MPEEIGATEWLANLSTTTIVLTALALTLVRLVMVRVNHAFARAVAELSESLVLAGIVVFLIVRPFFVQAFFIPTESMEPTLAGHNAGDSTSTGTHYDSTIHDHIFVNKLIYRFARPQHGDIIVFRAEKKADIQGGQTAENVLIKRLIGCPGDTIEVRTEPDGATSVYRNGKQLKEPYIREPMRETPAAEFATRGPLKLGQDEFFVMGDNRNNSNDGRYWGTLPRSRIIGRADVTFWPPSRIRSLR